jgi:hypothetical protein
MMKMNLLIQVALLIAAVAVFTPTAHAQNGRTCTNKAIAGTYSLTRSGWTSARPPSSLVPTMQVGVVLGDADGTWSGFSAIDIGGHTIIPKTTVVGTTNVNPDCTGNIVYNKGTATE